MMHQKVHNAIRKGVDMGKMIDHPMPMVGSGKPVSAIGPGRDAMQAKRSIVSKLKKKMASK